MLFISFYLFSLFLPYFLFSRAVRIFISSTFVDMHGERDVLTRVVLPEVKERAKQRKVKIYEVDLRWVRRVMHECLCAVMCSQA
jgi:hypothetical protein